MKIGDATVCEKGDGSTCENGGTVDVKVQQQVWGTPWTPEEFLERAVAAGHPASFGSYLPETFRRCISRSLGMTASERVAARASALKFWLRRSLELRTVETEIHAKLDSGVEEVVRGKRIAL